MGRRKVEMAMVKDRSSRQVTFSKRRMGLFKKANELATLCACQIALVVFSPGGKPYSFGHPDIETVAERFLNQENKHKGAKVQDFVDPQQKARVEKLNDELNEILKQLEEEKKRGEFLDEMMRQDKGSLESKATEEMGMDELLEMKEKLEALRINVKTRMIEAEASSSLLLLSKKPPKDVLKEPVEENS